MQLTKTRQIDLAHGVAIIGIGLLLVMPAIVHGVFDAQDLVLYHLKWAKYFSGALGSR
jgi:NADH:ubiquinone oxidoreductase subunit 4 (subunit M)